MNYEVKSAREASIREIFYDKNTNKLSYKNENGIIFILEGNQPGVNSAVEFINVTTQSEVVDMLLAGTLQPSSWYRFPYQSVNFVHGGDGANSILAYPSFPSYNATEVHVGPVEYLLAQAISETNLSPIVYSESYPQDILTYLPYVNKLGLNFDIYEGNTLPDSSVVTGFELAWDGTNVYFNMPAGYPALLGHYFYLYAGFQSGMTTYSIDGVYEPLTPEGNCQFSSSTVPMPKIILANNNTKIILEGLTFADYTNYQINSLYVEHVYGIEDTYGWVTKRVALDNSIEVPFDFRNHRFRRYEMDLTPVNTGLGLGYWGYAPTLVLNTQGVLPAIIPINTTGNYEDFPAFALETSGVYSVKIEGTGGPDTNYNLGVTDNTVFLGFCINNKFEHGVSTNTLESSANNVVGALFLRNICGDSFGLNFIGFNFYDNLIGNQFELNTIKGFFAYNNIKDIFHNNNIFLAFQSNRIGEQFSKNSMENTVTSNTIGDNFTQNYFSGVFNTNTINDGCYNNKFNEYFTDNTLGGALPFENNLINTGLNSINFVSATHVYAAYNCTIFLNSANTARLSYIDGTDTIIYTTVNS